MPPPLPLPPLPDTPPARPPRRRWPGYVLLVGLVALGCYLLWGMKVLARAANDQAAVRGVLDDQQAAWNRGDLDGFMVGYWNDPGVTFYSGGTATEGWQGTMDRYRKRYLADGKEMGTLTFSDQTIDLLGRPDEAAAVVRGRWALTFAKSADRPSGLYTLLMRKTPDGWKIVHDHTSAADPAKKD